MEAAPEIVALDEGGAVLPLASEEAAETVASGDPYFKDGAIYRGWSDTGGLRCDCITGKLYAFRSWQRSSGCVRCLRTSATATGPIYMEADTYILTGD